MTDQNPERNSPEIHLPSGPRKSLWLGKMITLILVLGVSAWACYVWVNSDDGFDFHKFTFQSEVQSKLYPVDGKIYFNGELIKHGHVEAYSVKGGSSPTRVIGAIKEDGSFELYSEFSGKMELGAPAGEYKLLLMVHHPATGFGYPAKLFPPEYYDVSRSPVTIHVTPDPAGNHLEVKGSGELNLNSAATRELDSKDSKNNNDTKDIKDRKKQPNSR